LTRALTVARPIVPTSRAPCPWHGRREFLPPWSGRHSGRATPSLRADQTTAKPTGRESTYPAPIPVQTNPATADGIVCGEEGLQCSLSARCHPPRAIEIAAQATRVPADVPGDLGQGGPKMPVL